MTAVFGRPTPPGRTQTPAERLRRFARRGLQTTAIAFVIAACLWAMTRNAFAPTLVYSLCIALSCWILIDVGRQVVVSRLRSAQVGWPGMAAIVVVGAPLGYAIGTEIANRLTGLHVTGPFAGNAREVVSLLVLSVLPALVITHYFHSREVIAGQRAEAERAERQAAMQQLKLLEAQLEPHMLFNTLANLRVLITVDPARAQEMLDRLIAFLRASLAGSRNATHPLAAEFERLRDYLALMQVRMGARLETTLTLPPELAGIDVPPMILQPLVENAIKHGLEPKLAGGRIDVTASRDGDALVLVVEDSGVGLREPVDAAGPGGGGYGLAHVRERVAAVRGGRHGTAGPRGGMPRKGADHPSDAAFEIAPRDGEGTRAVVRLPLTMPAVRS